MERDSLAVAVNVVDERIVVELDDCRSLRAPLDRYPRLAAGIASGA
jgi:hypothetical protein